MIVVIIQARMGSTRLPGKVLQKVLGKTLLEHLISRVKRAKTLDAIIVATTTNTKDAPITALAKKLGVGVYRGSEDDVLDRYYQTAKEIQADTIVRLTGDCPVMDPAVIDHVVRFFLKNKSKFDYMSNVNPPTFPDGMDVEVFSFKALEKAWKEAKKPSEREHVTPFMRDSGKFRTANVENAIDLSSVRLTVDESPDLALIEKTIDFFAKQGSPDFCLQDITALWQEDPDFFSSNHGLKRNEGYQKSLREEAVSRSFDVIAILGGGLVQEKGKWRTTNFKEKADAPFALGDRLRVVAGAVLYEESKKTTQKTLIFASGGRGEIAKIPDAPTVASVIKSELLALRILAKAIITDEESATTYEQLGKLDAQISEKEKMSIALISNEYHLPRIRAMIDYLPEFKNLKRSVQNEKLVLISAESVLAGEKKWDAIIQEAYTSEAMQKIHASEAHGVKNIKAGTYAYGEVRDQHLSLRKATAGDARFLYDLRSEEAVRQASFSNDIIPFEQHSQWFQKKLADCRSMIFIPEIDGASAGQVRFDIREDGAADINIAISQNFRGKGYGSKVVKIVARHFFTAFPRVHKIHAFIKPENEASLKLFSGAGFHSLGNAIERGHPCVNMVLIR